MQTGLILEHAARKACDLRFWCVTDVGQAKHQLLLLQDSPTASCLVGVATGSDPAREAKLGSSSVLHHPPARCSKAKREANEADFLRAAGVALQVALRYQLVSGLPGGPQDPVKPSKQGALAQVGPPVALPVAKVVVPLHLPIATPTALRLGIGLCSPFAPMLRPESPSAHFPGDFGQSCTHNMGSMLTGRPCQTTCWISILP
mmetsp:Transcript_56235/g.134002  ORF Transcript_56235/g.134002 Transcript_56235/m.134002 type:complete len:203 (-) Transcript_56235:729-1337(-)